MSHLFPVKLHQLVTIILEHPSCYECKLFGWGADPQYPNDDAIRIPLYSPEVQKNIPIEGSFKVRLVVPRTPMGCGRATNHPLQCCL